MKMNPTAQPELTITLRPATGPELADYFGQWTMANANQGKVAVGILSKHVTNIEGGEADFKRSDPKRFDALEVETILEVAGFVMTKGRLTEEDAGN